MKSGRTTHFARTGVLTVRFDGVLTQSRKEEESQRFQGFASSRLCVSPLRQIRFSTELAESRNSAVPDPGSQPRFLSPVLQAFASQKQAYHVSVLIDGFRQVTVCR